MPLTGREIGACQKRSASWHQGETLSQKLQSPRLDGLFLSASSREHMCTLGPSSTLARHMTDPQTCNCRRRFHNIQILCTLYILWGCPRGVMVKAMDGGIVVSEFVLQLRYYVHFRVNTLGKGMNPLILPAMD